MPNKRYSVAQWATGNIGLRSLEAIIAHPHLDLVGLRVYSPAKVGRDAGELCGLPPTGVLATNDIETIIAARPDCVVYMPDPLDMDDLLRLLEKGINIVTACIGFSYRDHMPLETRQQVEAACRRGNSSLYGSGSTPGWSTEILPVALVSLMRRLDCITITEFADCSAHNAPQMLFDQLHFGADPKSLDPNEPHGTSFSTPPSLRATLASFGLLADSFECTVEYALTRKRETIAAGTVEAGTIGAMRMVITASCQGKAMMRRRTTFYITKDIEPRWELRANGWHYQVEGDTPMDVMITIPEEEYPIASPNLSAYPIVNAIPFVCDAPPGICHTSELPTIIPYFGA